jgi:hypothetical protein
VKGRNIMLVGVSFVAHDLEDYIAEKKRKCFNEILGSRKVGYACRDPYTICFLSYIDVFWMLICVGFID